jgi:hypothetical protein
MLPPSGAEGRDAPSEALERLVRTVSIGLSTTVVAWLSAITVNAVTLGCGLYPLCLESNGVAGFVLQLGPWRANPSRLLIIGVFGTAALWLIALWYIAGKSRQASASPAMAVQDCSEADCQADASVIDRLGDPCLWRDLGSERNLALLHTASGLGAAAAAAAWGLGTVDSAASGFRLGFFTFPAVVAACVVVTAAIAAVFLGRYWWLAKPLFLAALVVSGLVLLVGFIQGVPTNIDFDVIESSDGVAVTYSDPIDLGWHVGRATANFVTYGGLALIGIPVVAIAVGLTYAAIRRGRKKEPAGTETNGRIALGGYGALVSLMLGIILTLTIVTGVMMLILGLLGEIAPSDIPSRYSVAARSAVDVPVMRLPDDYDAIGLAWAVIILTLVALPVVRFLLRPRDVDADSAAWIAGFRGRIGELPSGIDPQGVRWQHESVRAWADRTVKMERLSSDWIPWMRFPLAVSAALGALAFAVAGAFTFLTFLTWTPAWSTFAALARWILPVIAVVTGWLLIKSWRDRRALSAVGIVWDVLTFWPRSFMPFAPPSYPSRAVTDLSSRVNVLLDGEAQSVILAGHSQGSILVVATYLQLTENNDGMQQRLGLLTYGSPIRTLYRRYYPAYFGDPVTEEVRRRAQGRWLNLYRRTDPIGGPVEADVEDKDDHAGVVSWRDSKYVLNRKDLGVDARSDDPWPASTRLAGLPVPKGHSGYEDDPPYSVCLEAIRVLVTGDQGRVSLERNTEQAQIETADHKGEGDE